MYKSRDFIPLNYLLYTLLSRDLYDQKNWNLEL